MHIVLLLVVIGVLLFLLFQKNNVSPNIESDREGAEQQYTPEANIAESYNANLAWISKGKLFVRKASGDVVQIHSEYIQGMIDRIERNKQRNAWKKNTSFESGIGNRWGKQGEDVDKVSIHFSAAQFDQGKLIYFLKDFDFGGLFEYDLEQQKERRLIHSQKLLLENLNLNKETDIILCAQISEGGVSNIAKMQKDGTALMELTEGDTLDTDPCWIPGNENEIVFQSSGIARTQDGYIAAYGPASLQMLNLNDNKLTAVLEDPAFDFMQPKVSPNGDLYYIRRPYKLNQYGGGAVLSDIVLFPFRLLRAIFHYLNFFSMMYTRKPLTSASGPKFEADLKQMIVKGMRFDAEKALRKEGMISGVPSLVPKSWQLICRNPQGREQVLATNVASFDINSEGLVLYSNGFGVFVLGASAEYNVVLKDNLISEIFV